MNYFGDSNLPHIEIARFVDRFMAGAASREVSAQELFDAIVALANPWTLLRVGDAAHALYMAGRWECHALPESEQARLWEALRDALGLPQGTATAAGVANILATPMTTHQAAHVAALEAWYAAREGGNHETDALEIAVDAAIAALTASPQAAPEGGNAGYSAMDALNPNLRVLREIAAKMPQSWEREALFHAELDLSMQLKRLASPQVQGVEAVTTKLREIFDERVEELAQRLVASGPKAAHVSASECHEITDAILDARAALASGPSGVDRG
jgi:hypothetical protein